MKKKYLIIVIVFLLVLIGVKNINNKNKKNTNEDFNIEKVLSSPSYAYLPDEAKDYVREVYEKEGYLILTEKNKQENKRYLNPNYVEYLTYSAEEKKKVEVIPNETIIDYVPNTEKGNEVLEEKYNSLDYITPMKDQGPIGLCWAYATIETAETTIMKTNNKPYKEGVSDVLSPRHLDYVTSSDGIIDYTKDEYGHMLGEGYNVSNAIKALAHGETLFNEDWKYNYSLLVKPLEMSLVHNYKLSKYELDSSIEMPVSNSNDEDIINNYINEIKSLIKKYGSAAISSQAPTSSCSAINANDPEHYIVDVDSECIRNGNHSMQVVGWDDNYSYKYCNYGIYHEMWNESCSKEHTVEGKGALIVRNSWGDTIPFLYISYNTTDAIFDFITSLDSSENRKWNYVYNELKDNLIISSNGKSYYIKTNSKFNTDSNLIKIKFKVPSAKTYIKVYYSFSGKDEDYKLLESIYSDYPGYYTIDLSNKKYKITNKSKIRIDAEDELLFMDTGSISLFTSEKSDNKYASMEDLYYDQNESQYYKGYYKMRLLTDTYNIEDQSKINYQLYDDKNNNITKDMVVTNNVVGFNETNTSLYLPKLNGEYFTVKMVYDGKTIGTSKLTTVFPTPKQGKGTIDDPYVIMTPEDLYLIRYNMDKHYVLGADIDLTYDTQNVNGKYYNDGSGWKSLDFIKGEDHVPFSGSLNGYYNGKYHKIIGMKTSEDGLFYSIEGNNTDVSIKNIIFEKAIVKSSNLLSDTITGSVNSKVYIENIAAIDCNLSDESEILSKNIYSYGKDSIIIDSVFSNSIFNVDSNLYVSFLADYVDTYYYDEESSIESIGSIKLSNIQILGKINSTASTCASLFNYAGDNGNIYISNVFFNINSIYKVNLSLYEGYNRNIKYKNVYYQGAVSEEGNTLYNVAEKSITELVQKSSYSKWENFSSKWLMKTVGSIPRIPILRFVPYQYTSVSVNIDTIDLTGSETLNIYDYISVNNIYNIKVEPLDVKISLDEKGNIKGLLPGTSTIRVTGIDGFNKDIIVNISKDENPIKDKNVVNVKIVKNEKTKVYVLGFNKSEEIIWNKELNIENDKIAYITSGEQGTKYYYFNCNGKLYALDIQTGKVLWSTNSEHIDSNSDNNNYVIKHIEAGDKLVEIAGEEPGKMLEYFEKDPAKLSVIAIYDINTGKLLKSIKDVDEKYITSNNNNSWNYYLHDLEYSYSNDLIYIDVIGRYENAELNYSDDNSSFLKIDVNNYKIQFTKSKYDVVKENVVDKNIVDVAINDEGNLLIVKGINKNGEIVWNLLFNKYYGDATNVVKGEKNYYINIFGVLYAIDIQTGEILWNVNGDFDNGSMIEAAGKLFVASMSEQSEEITYGVINMYVYDVKTGNSIDYYDVLLGIPYIYPNAYLRGMFTKKISGKEYIYIPIDDYIKDNKVNVYKLYNLVGYIKINIKNGEYIYEKIENVTSEIPEKNVVNVEFYHNKICGTNNAKQIVWSKYINKMENGFVFLETHDTNNKNYYFIFNGKMYAVDMQTGKNIWTINTILKDSTMLKVVGDKLVSVSDDNNGTIVVYDTKTGKVLSSIKNIKDKYLSTLGEKSYINVDKTYLENGIIYVPVNISNNIGYLKIDINKSKIKFQYK